MSTLLTALTLHYPTRQTVIPLCDGHLSAIQDPDPEIGYAADLPTYRAVLRRVRQPCQWCLEAERRDELG